MARSPTHIINTPQQVTEQLGAWYAQGTGEYLNQELDDLMTKHLRNQSGYHATEFGFFKHANDWFADSHVRKVFYLQVDGGDITADFERLPLTAESMDCVVASHALEFVQEPHQVLREIERVLIPEGQVIIVAFNPYGLQGLRKLLRRTYTAPWHGRFYSAWRIKEWLSVLGFEVRMLRYLAPPFVARERFAKMSSLCRQYLPWTGSAIVIAANKLVSRLTPLHLRENVGKLIKGQVAQPTAFGSEHYAKRNFIHLH